MPDVSIGADGSLAKGFFIILLGAILGGFLKYAWDITLGKLIDQTTGGRV
jgi:hypothetical protein